MIVVRVGGRWKNDGDVWEMFEDYGRTAETRFALLSALLHVAPPEQVLLRPFYYKGEEVPIFHGRAIYKPKGGFSIALTVPVCMADRYYGLIILDHEISHIMAAIKYGYWGHDHTFKSVLALCEKARTLRWQ